VANRSFRIHAPSVWKLSDRITTGRKARLLETHFEEIVEMIGHKGQLVDLHWEDSCRQPECHRLEGKLWLPAIVVDLFHNGAGGYRAQYLEGPLIGEAANRLVLHSIASSLARDSELGLRLLRSPHAKLWVHEGGWLDPSPFNMNLKIDHWRKHAEKYTTLSLRFDPPYAGLTPDDETCLEVKGSWINKETDEIVEIKSGRSDDIHNFGFT
jgi:hypothetical protein